MHFSNKSKQPAKATKPNAPSSPRSKPSKDAPKRPAPRRGGILGMRLHEKVLNAWQKTVLEVARFPKGMKRGETDEKELLDGIIRQEFRGIEYLWETFTQERQQLSRQLLSARKEVVAYLLGFHLVNAARVQIALSRLEERWNLEAFYRSIKGRLLWHDFGCGTGAASQVALTHALARGLTPERFGVHLVDNTGSLLDVARVVLQHTAPEVEATNIRSHRTPIESLPMAAYKPSSPQDVMAYSLSYVWNELEKNKKARQVLKRIFVGHIEREEASLILLLEPANQDFSRDAMALRDELCEAGYEALYPCPGSQACPMLLRSRDWCYSEALWARPRSMAFIDKLIGTDRSRISSTILVLASPALAKQLQPKIEPKAVVVGRPNLVQKPVPGKMPAFEYLLCTGTELKKAPAASSAGRGLLLRGMPHEVKKPQVKR